MNHPRIVVWLVLLVLLLSVPSCARKGEDKSKPFRPNIVFVLLDAARADHFSGYGYPRPTTPRIDAIGEKGAVLLDTSSPATETFAVMPLIMSSRYFSRPIFQMDTWGWGLRRETPETIFQDYDREQILLPALLTAVGYRTAIFHNHPWFADGTELVRAFQESHFFPMSKKKPFDETMVAEVLDWIRGQSGGPFFVYYHIMSPHQPYPPKEEDNLFIKSGEEAVLTTVREKFEGPGGASAADWSPEELYYFSVLYDSNLAHSDRWVGRLYEGLEELGLARNTIFIVSSDHGELLGEHKRMTHGDFLPWEALLRVPLIITWPERIPAGIRVSGLTETVDIFPTICALAGLELPPGKRLDGIDLQLLSDNPGSGREASYIKDSVRTVGYKYMIGRDLFFDLVVDPEELSNISAQVSAVRREQLEGDYESFTESFRDRFREAVQNKPPPEPFYYPVNTFLLTPKSAYATFGSEQFPDHLLAGPVPERVWHLNTSDRHGYLISIPGERVPPVLTLSAALPDGNYLISVLIDTLSGRPVPPDGKEFLARFQSAESFIFPFSVREFSLDGEGPFYYLNYGWVMVRDQSFSVELDYRSVSLGTPFLIRHVKFSPPEVQPAETIGENESLERIRSLRSLGYVK